MRNLINFLVLFAFLAISSDGSVLRSKLEESDLALPLSEIEEIEPFHHSRSKRAAVNEDYYDISGEAGKKKDDGAGKKKDDDKKKEEPKKYRNRDGNDEGDPHVLEYMYGKNSYREKQGRPDPNNINDAPGMKTNEFSDCKNKT